MYERAQAGDAFAKRSLAQEGVSPFSVSTPASRGVPEQQARDDANFQAANDNLARVMGRGGQGLTDGAASRRGQAGRQVNVPPGAMYKPPNQTYWNQGNAQTGQGNTVAAQGELARAAQAWQDAGKDKKAQNAAKQALIKSYNDSPFSSVTDATDIEFDKDGNMKFKVGDKYINNKPVSVDDFRKIGESNNLTPQTVFQRQAGSGPMAAGGQGLQQPNKREYDAAKLMGEADIKMMGDQVNALEKQLDITPAEQLPALKEQILKAKDAQRQAIAKAGSDVLRSGMQGLGPQSITPDRALQQLVDSNKSDTEIQQVMWDKYGDEGVMRGVQSELQRRSGLQQPKTKAGIKAEKDIPVSKDGQPGLQLGTSSGTTPTAKPVPAKSQFQQKYDTETKSKREKEAKTKSENEVFRKVRRLYDNMNTVKNLKQEDVDYLQSVYGNPNANAKVKKEAYATYKKYRDSIK